MADFKTALETLAKGELSIENFATQLSRLLDQAPQHATRMLSQLDEMYGQKKINDKIYTQLKGQINQYRRTHTLATETGDGGVDSTVFDKDSIPQQQTPAVKTQIDSGKTTQLASDKTTKLAPEKTVAMAGGASDTAAFNITGGDDMSPVSIDLSTGNPVSSMTGAAEPTGTGLSDPAASAQPISRDMGPGSTIKHRFRLLEVLGVGGMGKVYKGIDLLKEEARDRNPYVAIKLLNDDFRDHPEAFISLQRESSRQQKLAHPNIATVYDFDRIGGQGTPVFITMELMEGMPLNDYIKKTVKKQNGLPFNEAFNIIKQLCAALAYAHERRLVHSDFKPGNAFLCNDGTVKTLDFGIARAVKNPTAGEGEKTLFDPGKLGALTPAYASLEMLQGEEPDTRDDTYALGCVAYELLTGKHPFNKLAADKAMNNKLVPPYIKSLKKKQNNALRSSVAFHRKDRPASVNDFLEELEARYIWYKHPLTVAAIVLLTLGIGGTAPVMKYYHQQEIDQIISDMKSGDSTVLVDRLAMIDQYDKAEQLSITNEAKDAIQDYFKGEINKYIDTSASDYSFPKANKVLDQIASYYPDSSFLLEQTEVVKVSQKRKLGELYSEFSDNLKDPSLLGNIAAILETIRTRIDPNNPLLTDPSPSYQYRVLADEAFANGRFDEALSLVKSGVALAPQEQTLKDTQTKIERAIKVAALQQQIGVVQGQLVSLQDYQNIQKDIIDLATLSPDDPLITALSASSRPLVAQQITALASRTDAENMAQQYGDLLRALRLGQELTQIKLAHLSGAERATAVQQIVAGDNATINKLLEKPVLDDDKWKSEMLASMNELDSLSREEASIASNLIAIREKIAQLYVTEVKTAIDADRFDAATSFVDSAERFAPGLNSVRSARESIATAKQAFDTKQKIDGLKRDFKGQIDANQIVKALEYYEQLKVEAPQDSFVTGEAPVLIASSYRTLAKGRAESKAYADALKLADQGMIFNPGDKGLENERKGYLLEANIAELDTLFANAVTFNTDDIRRKVAEIDNVGGIRASEFKQQAVAGLVKRINSLRVNDENAAAILAQNAAIVFPATALDSLKNELKPQPWPEAGAAQVTLTAGKLNAGAAIQQSAAENFGSHPEYLAFVKALTTKKAEAQQVFEQFIAEKTAAGENYEALTAAKKLLIRAQSLWTDNTEYDAADKEISALIVANSPASKKIIQREDLGSMDLSAAAKPGEPKKEWKPADSGRQCNLGLAGYGKRAKAICFDLVNDGWRGPLMVVVPAGDNGQAPFAIGKYEVSVADYSKYCAVSGNCTPVTDKTKFNEPQTGITLQQAEEYTKWLSERTGKTYRLPSKAEWEYAAKANGEQARDFNCRLALGDKIIKGTGIAAVTSGQANGWGLKNYIGNVQEWVIDEGGVKVRGGAYEDSHSKCDLTLERAHSGQADGTTGFRLVLEGVG